MPKRKQIEETSIDTENQSTDSSELVEVLVVEPYTIIFTNGDPVAVPVEALCVPVFLEPFYNNAIAIIYNGKRITHMSREHGIFRLVLEDGTRAAIVSGQMLTVTHTPIVREEPPQDETIADGDAAG